MRQNSAPPVPHVRNRATEIAALRYTLLAMTWDAPFMSCTLRNVCTDASLTFILGPGSLLPSGRFL